AAVVREWARAPAYVPAAAEILAARGEIAPFARAIAPAEALRLLEAVLRVHALPALAGVVVRAATASAGSPAATAIEPRDVRSPESQPRAEPLAAAPWRAVVPDRALAKLTVEQQSFAAIALVLRRAPALARSERFAIQVATWIERGRRGERWP